MLATSPFFFTMTTRTTNHSTGALRPDVVIVVKGTEFEANSMQLRVFSGYFDEAFTSGTEEARSMRFNFPDGDPYTFGVVFGMFQPFSAGDGLTFGNCEGVLHWFSRLLARNGMQMCDRACWTKCGNPLLRIIPHSTVYWA
jgi:BTB/POZ domain